MEKKEKWREKLEQFKQDDRYDYLIELLLPYTAGLRAGSLDKGFLPILCEVEELLDKAKEEGRRETTEDFISELECWKVAWIDRTKDKGAEYLRDALLKLLKTKEDEK